MDATMIVDVISSVGFPVAACGAMAWFIYQVFIKTTAQSQENMEKLQATCKEREDRLYEEIKENREVNASAVATIGLYADKLDTIQSDLAEIKTDIAVIASKE